MLVLEARADQVASPPTVLLLRSGDALVEGARVEAWLGYQGVAKTALAFPASFRLAYLLYRY